ncbi:MAG: hypothetical protein HKN92_05120 [Chitinophagales bacterium]|nr:hypothetical protein [Chitinophagales bacterium]
MELVALLVIVIIVGALLGAKSLGGTIRTGCGCISLVIIVGIILIGLRMNTSDSNTNFEVIQHCKTYTKPDINSEVNGSVNAGVEIYVEDKDKYNYFYEVETNSGDKYYILKENLRSFE